MRLLLVEASPRQAESVSREAAGLLVAALAPAMVVRRDLAADPPPLPDAGYADAIRRRAAPDDPAFAASELFIGEIEAADALAIATPMHNYTVPAVLKAWIDHVVRIGRSFAPMPDGKRGLLADRPCFVVVATGGPVSAGAARQPDFLTPYLTAILATIGIRDLRFLMLEAVRDPTARAAAMARAKEWSAAQSLLVPAGVS